MGAKVQMYGFIHALVANIHGGEMEGHWEKEEMLAFAIEHLKEAMQQEVEVSSKPGLFTG